MFEKRMLTLLTEIIFFSELVIINEVYEMLLNLRTKFRFERLINLQVPNVYVKKIVQYIYLLFYRLNAFVKSGIRSNEKCVDSVYCLSL